MKIKLDKRSQIFQNLNGASHEIILFAENDQIFVYNNITESIPSVIHGNGGSKVKFDHLFRDNIAPTEYIND